MSSVGTVILSDDAGTSKTWKRVRVGETLRLINGVAFKPTDWSDQGLPIVRIQNLNNPHAPFNHFAGERPEKFRLRGGELLFAWSGTPGTSFGAHVWRGSDAWLNQHIFKVEFDDAQWDKRFLQLAINQNLAEYVRAAHGGAGLAHITKGRFEDSELPQPPLPEQQRIVAEIEKQVTRLEAGVAALRRAQANLKRYRAAVLKAACEGRLVPTEAEVARREGREYEDGQALLARVLEDRLRTSRHYAGKRGDRKPPAALDSVPQRAIPKGWTWATLDMLGQEGRPIIYGIIKPGPHVPDGVPYVRVTEMKDGRVDVGRLRRAAPERAARFARATLVAGDLLISKDGTIGRVAVVPPELEGGNITQHVMRVPVHEAICRNYVVWAVRSDELQHWLTGETKGVALQGVNVEDFRRLPIPLPPLAEQHRIVAEVERRLSVVEELEAAVAANLARAARLRQAILQRAFSGELVAAEGTDGARPRRAP